MDFTGHQHILAQYVIQRLQQFSNGTVERPSVARLSSTPYDGIFLTGGITADGLDIPGYNMGQKPRSGIICAMGFEGTGA